MPAAARRRPREELEDEGALLGPFTKGPAMEGGGDQRFYRGHEVAMERKGQRWYFRDAEAPFAVLVFCILSPVYVTFTHS